MATSLDDVLNDEKPQAPLEPEAPAEPSEPAADKPEIERPTSRRAEHRKVEFAAQGRDPETGKFLPKEPEAKEPEKPAAAAPTEPAKAPEKPAAPPAQPDLTERERAFLAKANDEARKRQALEQRLAEAGQKPAEPPKAFWDDPEGALKKHREEMAHQNLNTRLQTAELIARSRYTDFEEKVGKFAEIVQQNPALAPMWLNSPDPAEFAYRTAKNHMELQQVGSLDALRAKIIAETEAATRTKVEAEFKKKQEDLDKQRAALTPSLSDVRGATSNKAAPAWGGPTPLDDILSGK